MYEAFREAPQSKKDRSRLKLGLWITLAAIGVFVGKTVLELCLMARYQVVSRIFRTLVRRLCCK